jgi:hypothetical protein
MRATLLALSGLLVFLGSCRSPQTEQQRIEKQHGEAWLEVGAPDPPVELPLDWLLGTAHQFAQGLESWNLSQGLLWSHSAQERLTEVLLQPSEDARSAQNSIRAALLLAFDSSAPSQTALLIRLERRLAPQERGRQGVEVVCANAMARMPHVENSTLGSLSKLAFGPIPHPDLDVRVECARALLAHVPMSEEGPTPLKARDALRFLIKVLRAETPAQVQDAPTWPRIETLAWPKGRAAQELARWHPTEVPFLPDGSWQSQMEWAQAAQTALGL